MRNPRLPVILLALASCSPGSDPPLESSRATLFGDPILIADSGTLGSGPTAPPAVGAEIERAKTALAAAGATFSIGWTAEVGPRSLAQLTGFRAPASVRQSFQEKVAAIPSTSVTLPSSFNWAVLGKTTPVKDQLLCGSCWAFTMNEIVEDAYKIVTGEDSDLSEQFLVSCNRQNFTCDHGGFWAFEYYKDKYFPPQASPGTVSEEDFLYGGGYPLSCPATTLATAYKLEDWHFIDTTSGIVGGVPSVGAIKRAVMERGPVATGICAAAALHWYTSGVIDQEVPGYESYCGGTHDIFDANHAVTIVGWVDDRGPDDGYWVVQNSWGNTWGERADGSPWWTDVLNYYKRGFFRIRYGVTNIGVGSVYVELRDPALAPGAPTVVVAGTGDPHELGPSGSFTITRSGDASSTLVVSFSVGGTATPGVDYLALGEKVTFAPGARNATVTVAAIPDRIADDGETVVLTLTPGPAYTVGTPGSASVTIEESAGGTTSGPSVGPLAPTAVQAGTRTVVSATYRTAVGVRQCVLSVNGAFIGTMRLRETQGVDGKVLGTASLDWSVSASLPRAFTAEVDCTDRDGVLGWSSTPIRRADGEPPQVGQVDFRSKDFFWMLNSPNVVALGDEDEWHAGFTDALGVSSCAFYVDGAEVGPMTLDCDWACTSGSARIAYAFTAPGDHTAQVRCQGDNRVVGVGPVLDVTVKAMTPGHVITLDPTQFPVTHDVDAFVPTSLSFRLLSDGPIAGCRYRDREFWTGGSFGNDAEMTLSATAGGTTASVTVLYGGEGNDLLTRFEEGGAFSRTPLEIFSPDYAYELGVKPVITCWDATNVPQVVLNEHLFADAVRVHARRLDESPQTVLSNLVASGPVVQGRPATVSVEVAAPGPGWPVKQCRIRIGSGGLVLPGTLSDPSGLGGTASFTIPATTAWESTVTTLSVGCDLENVWGPPFLQRGSCGGWLCYQFRSPELTPVTLDATVQVDTSSPPLPVFEPIDPTKTDDIEHPTTFSVPYHVLGGLASCLWADKRAWSPEPWHDASLAAPESGDGALAFTTTLEVGTAQIELACVGNDGARYYVGGGDTPWGWAYSIPGLRWVGFTALPVNVSDARAMTFGTPTQAPETATVGRALFVTVPYHAPRGLRGCTFDPRGTAATLSSPGGTDGFASVAILPPAKLDPLQTYVFTCSDGRFSASIPIPLVWADRPPPGSRLFSEISAQAIAGTALYDVRFHLRDVAGVLSCELLGDLADPFSGVPMTLDDPGAMRVAASIEGVAPTQPGDPDRFTVSCTDGALRTYTRTIEASATAAIGAITPTEVLPGQESTFTAPYDVTRAGVPAGQQVLGLRDRISLPDHVLRFGDTWGSGVELGGWNPLAAGGQLTWHVRLRQTEVKNAGGWGTSRLIAKSNFWLSPDWYSLSLESGVPCFSKSSSTQGRADVCATAPIPKDAWVTVAVTYDDTSKRVLLYVDGTVVAAAQLSSADAALGPSSGALELGTGWFGYEALRGDLSDVLMFNAAQTDAVVKAYAAGGAVPAGDPSAVAIYRMRDPASADSVWIDASGNGRDGVPAGLTLIQDYGYAPFTGLRADSCRAAAGGLELGNVPIGDPVRGTLAALVPADFDWLGQTGVASGAADTLPFTFTCDLNAHLCPDWCVPENGWPDLEACDAQGYCPSFSMSGSATLGLVEVDLPAVAGLAPSSYALGSAVTITASYSAPAAVVSCSLSANGGPAMEMTLSAPGAAAGSASVELPVGFVWPNATSYLDSGSYALSVTCTDADGRQGGRGAALAVTAPTRTVIGQVAPLTVTAEAPITFTAAYAGGVGITDCVLLVERPPFPWDPTSPGPIADLGRMALAAPGAASGTATLTVPASFNWYPLDYYNYSDATQTVIVSCVDQLGRTSSSRTAVLVRRADRPPTQPVLTADPMSRTESPVFVASFAEESGVGGVHCSLDGAAYARCPAVVSSERASPFLRSAAITLGPLADGVHTLLVRIEDDAGQLSPASAPLSWLQDTGAPVVSVNADPSRKARYDRDGDGLPDSLDFVAADPSRAPGAMASGFGCYALFDVLATASGLPDFSGTFTDWPLFECSDSTTVPLTAGSDKWGASLAPYADQVTLRATTTDEAGNPSETAVVVARPDRCPDDPGAADHAGCPLAVRATVALDTVTRSGARTSQPLAGILVKAFDPADPGFLAANGGNPALWQPAAIYDSAVGSSCATDASGSCTTGFAGALRQVLVIARHTDPFTSAPVVESRLVTAAGFGTTKLAHVALATTTCDVTSGNCPFVVTTTVTLQTLTRKGALLATTELAGVGVRVFDVADPAFVARYGSDPKPILYRSIFDTSSPSAGRCDTGAHGACDAWLASPPGKKLLVLARFHDGDTGKTVYAASKVDSGQFKDLNRDGVKEHAATAVPIVKILDGGVLFEYRPTSQLLVTSE